MQIFAGVGAAVRVGVAGYFAGGVTASLNTAVINKLTFATESISSLSATLTVALGFPAGMANSGVAGYSAGGYDDSSVYTSGIEKVTFPADTKTTLAATLSPGYAYLAGYANSGVAGYYAGGDDGSVFSSQIILNYSFKTSKGQNKLKIKKTDSLLIIKKDVL